MIKLISQIVGFLADIVIYWAIPLIGATLFSAIATIIIAVNPILGAVVILAVAVLLDIYCFHQGANGQATWWKTLLLPYGILAIVSPHWAVLWGLGISVLALGILFIPGVILPQVRDHISNTILAVTVLHMILAFAVWSKGMIFLVVFGLLAIAVGNMLFSRAARPWEIRRAQRRLARLMIEIGILATITAIIWQIVWQMISKIQFAKF
jgi:hypothetical protein